MEGLPAKYAQTLQLLQKKKDELEQVFDEARALERDNTNLAAQNRELKSRNVELESATKSMSFEFAALEAQVRKQQMKLQHYIDQEAAGQGTTRPRPQDAQKIAQLTQEVSEWRKKCEHNEELLRKSEDAQGRMEKHMEGATGELRELRSKLTHATEAQRKAEAETQNLTKLHAELCEKLDVERTQRDSIHHSNEVLGQIEADALSGLRQEISILSSENHRLMDLLEEERAVARQVKAEYDRTDELIRKQRYLAEGQLKLVRDEISSLNQQNESLLGEVKRLLIDKEQLKKKVLITETAASQQNQTQSRERVLDVQPQVRVQSQPVPPPRPTLIDRGSMTVEVFLPTPMPTPPMQAPPSPQHHHDLEEREATISSLRSQLAKLQSRHEQQRADNEDLRALLVQKDETVQLLEEKGDFHAKEVDRLRLLVQQASLSTPLERLVQSPKSSALATTEDVKEVEAYVERLLLLGTKAYGVAQVLDQPLHDAAETHSSCSDADDATHTSRGGAVPIAPFHRFRDVQLNSVMSQLGGLRFILKRVLKTLRVHANRMEFARSTNVPALKQSTGAGSARQSHTAAVQAEAHIGNGVPVPSFDVDAWITERRREGGTAPRSRIPESSTETSPSLLQGGERYTAGTTLLDVVEELRRTPPVRYRRR